MLLSFTGLAPVVFESFGNVLSFPCKCHSSKILRHVCDCTETCRVHTLQVEPLLRYLLKRSCCFLPCKKERLSRLPAGCVWYRISYLQEAVNAAAKCGSCSSALGNGELQQPLPETPRCWRGTFCLQLCASCLLCHPGRSVHCCNLANLAFLPAEGLWCHMHLQRATRLGGHLPGSVGHSCPLWHSSLLNFSMYSAL